MTIPGRKRWLFAALLLALLATPLFAYRLVMKDGRIMRFEKYRVTEKTLYYTGEDGKDVAVLLTDIDMDQTQRLNAQESVPLNLPGMASPSQHTSDNAEPSLAEIARQAGGKSTTSITKRVFTDDDLKHGSSQPPLPDLTKTVAGYRNDTEAYLQDAEKYADSLNAKTPRQLGEIVAKDIQFPGRDAWEKQLADRRDALVTATQTTAFSVRRAQTLSEGNDKDGAQDAHTAVQEQLTRLYAARRDYERVLADGADKAAKWERERTR